MTVHYSYYFEELMFKFSLTPDIVKASPQWPKRADYPPLPPRRAIDKSLELLGQMLGKYGTTPDPRFRACALMKVGDIEGDWWYYLVTWAVWPPEGPGDRASIDVPVLM